MPTIDLDCLPAKALGTPKLLHYLAGLCVAHKQQIFWFALQLSGPHHGYSHRCVVLAPDLAERINLRRWAPSQRAEERQPLA